MNENVSDADLERFLRRRDRLSQEYAALPRQDPAAELDAAVLERARRALEEDPPRSGWRHARWPRITALAATVVLSFAAIVRLAIEIDEPVLAPLATRPQAQDSKVSPAAAPAAEAVRAESAEDQEYAPAISAAVPVADTDIGGTARARESAHAPAAPPAAAHSPAASPSPATASKPSAGTLRTEALLYSQDAAQAATSAAGADGESNAARPVSAERGRESPARELPLSDEARRRLQRRDALIAEREQAAIRKEAASPAVSQATSAPGNAMPTADTPHGATPTSAAAMEPAPAGEQKAEAVDTRAAAQVERDPAAWLREIERLSDAGRTEEAQRELRRLREAYPDYAPARAFTPTR